MSKRYPPLTDAELVEVKRQMAEARERARRLPELSPEEDAALTAAAESDPDSPPLRDDAVLRPAYEVVPHLVAASLRRRGRPQSPAPKKQVTLRLDQDVLDYFQSDGPGWQTRINDTLRRAAKRR